MASNDHPRYLKLKTKVADEFLDKARRRFPAAHIAGLCVAVKNETGISISKATIARILAGNRGEFEKVQALCDYYNVIPDDACEAFEEELLRSENNIAQLVDQARSRVSFIFETATSGSSRDQSSWVREHFVELDMVEVDRLPSEYPVLSRAALTSSKENNEDEFDRIRFRLLRGKKITGSAILEKHPKIFVFGDPGSGKTSYLQSVALRCRDGEILGQYVPVYIEIRHYCVSGGAVTLLTYIEKMFESWEITSQQFEDILNTGRVLFLVDGLDEAPEEELLRMHTMIQDLLSRYSECRFVCTARLGLGSNFAIRGTHKVIISPFYSRKQIPDFVRRWFSFYSSDPNAAESMLEKLRSAKYVGIREIARRPVLLDLLCLTYEHNGDFPEQRAGVFTSGLSTLASKAQLKSSIPIAEAPYFRARDIQNILARVANYFFIHLQKQVLFAIRDVERIIREYCQEVHSINPDTVDGTSILRGIEKFNGLLVQCGEIYCSFSHLTYQEYFTAEYLVNTNTYKSIYGHVSERRWSFVVELVSELVPREELWDFFLEFKDTVDGFVNSDTRIVDFLQRVDQAATFVTYTVRTEKPYMHSLVRAWYFVYAIEDTGSMNNIYTHYQRFDLPDFEFATSMVSNHILHGHEALYKAYHYCDDNNQAKSFETCMRQLQLSFTGDQRKQEVINGWLGLLAEQMVKYDSREDWWEAKRYSWQQKIARFLNGIRLPHTYELNDEQIRRLRTYYRVTKLLSNCINRSNLPDNRFAEMADSMLRLTHLFPESRA